ncbi:MAG: von Willebrand factor type A domain-containing protein [Puniceicoccaceae bacterium]
MKFSVNDPKITAYALGEIDDPKERQEIESAVAASEELQQAVASIREMGVLLSEGLAAEPVPELSEFDKARMEQVPDEQPVTRKRLIDRVLTWPALSAAVAAAVLAMVLVPQGILVNKAEQEAEAEAAELKPATGDIQTVQAAPPREEDEVRQNELQTLQSVVEVQKEPIAKQVAQLSERGRRDLLDSDANRVQTGTAASSQPMPTTEGKEEVFELSPFMVEAADDVGYTATNVATATTLVRKADKDQWNTESYDPIEETDFRSPLVAPLSTFSIDVDTASYANVRRFLNQGQLPPADAVRIEELINYFPYADKPPVKALDEGGDPFAVHMAQTTAPWNNDHRLLRIALKGYEMPWEERPASNLVFLLDVSGSMSDANKLPLVKKAMDLLVHRLDGRDRVAIVVYAGASGLVLPSTTANNHATIAHALENLQAGGSTNAGAGIQLAYKVARDNFIEDGNNRVILCTDGDFNVGQTNRGDLADIADQQAEDGISLTILGFGMGNYKDDMLETLSNKGKGSYAYIDSETEARKVFLQDLASNIFKIAKDVKIQVEFNPAHVEAYRLIGYENRRLKAEDFNNDQKKAGDIGPGHSIVALYEVIPSGAKADLPTVDDLKYQQQPAGASRSSELATVKLRYKQPDGDTSKLITHAVDSQDLLDFASAHEDVRFSAAVAAFGLRLSESENAGDISFKEIEQIATGAIGSDPGGLRSEFTSLVRKAGNLTARTE